MSVPDVNLAKLIPNARVLANHEVVDRYFTSLEDRYERKLWHQLTEILDKIYVDHAMGPLFIPLYDLFVLPLRRQLSSLSVAYYAIAASHRLNATRQSLEFVRKAAQWTTLEEYPQAHTLVSVREAVLLLRLGDVAAAKRLMDKCDRWIGTVPVHDPGVLGQFHNLRAEYAEIQGDHRAHYLSALSFFSCFPSMQSLPAGMALYRAQKLAVAGLLAPDLFDLSELLFHEVWGYLQEPDTEWIVELVRAVQFGDVQRWMRTKSRIFDNLPSQVIQHLPLIEQKICLSALVESVLKRPAAERTLPFSVIAREVNLQANARVEILLMKAFSLGLLNGRIDGVNKVVHVTWVQPRKLSYEQVVLLRQRVQEWDESVRSLGAYMRRHGDDVWNVDM